MNIEYKKLIKNKLDVVEDNGYYKPIRFSNKQVESFSKLKSAFRDEASYNSGVCLEFLSDCHTVMFDFIVEKTNETVTNFDVFINENYIKSVSINPLINVEQQFKLTTDVKGSKAIKIYLSYATSIKIKNFKVNDGSILKYVSDDKPLLLCLGDSITQGYSVLHSKNTYPIQLSHKLNMNLLNQGLSDYIHFYKGLDENLNIKPSIITSALGTNDWEQIEDLDQIKENIRLYLKTLHKLYPTVPTFIITPIYRGSYLTLASCGSFFDIASIIIKEADKYNNFNIIDGLDLVPHDDKYFDNSVLHPTDKGFDFYSSTLYDKIKMTLDIS
ncbi:MAG: SGNH/GDSL hydrolase family protein [Sphaerochaetaceae bacterium]|nr:SGNH/GDSL hydrolase family protein [Sphaerochaetaceae bacterium]